MKTLKLLLQDPQLIGQCTFYCSLQYTISIQISIYNFACTSHILHFTYSFDTKEFAKYPYRSCTSCSNVFSSSELLLNLNPLLPQTDNKCSLSGSQHLQKQRLLTVVFFYCTQGHYAKALKDCEEGLSQHIAHIFQT